MSLANSHSHSAAAKVATNEKQQNLVQLSQISVSFDGRHILQDVHLTVRKQEIVTLIGPNGAGKTTLVRIVLGLLKPQAGSVEIASGLNVGYMPQKLQLDSTLPLTVKRFLAMGQRNTEAELERLIDEALTETAVAHLVRQQMHKLSGGELQRVLLARALLRKPSLLILDEPAQGVDVSGQAELYQLIQNVRDRHNCGVLMVSHDLHLVMSATDEVVCLNHHVCCHGKPEQVSNDPSYLSLFGAATAENIAVYTHHHNHHHDIEGKVIEDCSEHP